MNDPKHSVTKQSTYVTLIRMAGLCFAVAVDLLMITRFGADATVDVYFLALTLPNILYILLISNCVPTILPLLQTADQQHTIAHDVSNIISWLLLAIGGTVLIGILITPLGLQIYNQLTDQALQTFGTQVATILFTALLPLALIEPIRAWLLLNDYFVLASFGYLLHHVVSLTTFLFGYQQWGVTVLAWGFLAGMILQLLFFCVVSVALWGRWFRPKLLLSQPIAKALFTNLLPAISGDLIRQSNVIVERIIAATLPVSTLSLVGYARRMLASLNGLFAPAITTVLLPRMTKAAQSGAYQSVGDLLRYGISLILLVTGNVTLGIASVGMVVIVWLFEWNSAEIQQLFTVFGLALPTIGLGQLGTTTLFALGKTQFVFASRAISMLAYLIISIIAVMQFGVLGLGIAIAGEGIIQLATALLFAQRQHVQLPAQFMQHTVISGGLLCLIALILLRLDPSWSKLTWQIAAFATSSLLFTAHILHSQQFVSRSRLLFRS